MSEEDLVRQVVVHPAVWESLEEWLDSRGILLKQLPIEDDLPTYVMSLKYELGD